MKLVEDWKSILKNAWSIKWSMVASALSMLELALPTLAPGKVPPGLMAIASIILTAFVIPTVRLLVQQEKQDAGQTPTDGK